jgi:hypothetical protein
MAHSVDRQLAKIGKNLPLRSIGRRSGRVFKPHKSNHGFLQPSARQDLVYFLSRASVASLPPGTNRRVLS